MVGIVVHLLVIDEFFFGWNLYVRSNIWDYVICSRSKVLRAVAYSVGAMGTPG